MLSITKTETPCSVMRLWFAYCSFVGNLFEIFIFKTPLKKDSIIIYLVIFAVSFLSAQTSNNLGKDLTVFRTTEYKSYIGYMEIEDSDSISIKTFNDEVHILSKSDIFISYPFTGRIKNGRLQRKDPNSSFYIFSPSAFAIESGNLYCRDFCLLWPYIR